MPREGKRVIQTEAEIVATLKEKEKTKVYKNTLSKGNARNQNISDLLNSTISNFKEDVSREKVSLTDTEKVKEHTFRYLKVCQKVGVLPDMQGLALSLGHTRNSLIRTKKEKADTPTGEFLEMCADFFSSLISTAANNGDINTIYAIFTQKARYDWRETSEILITPNNPLGNIKSADDLRKLAEKYSKDAIDVEAKDVE